MAQPSTASARGGTDKSMKFYGTIQFTSQCDCFLSLPKEWAETSALLANLAVRLALVDRYVNG